MHWLVMLAGLVQLGIALGSLAIPRALGWREETAKLKALTSQVFWNYAAYIWATNVAMGTLSLLMPDRLLEGTPLARAIASYIALYWGARFAVQFLWFDRSAAPPGLVFKLAEWGLVAAFVFLAGVYGHIALLGN